MISEIKKKIDSLVAYLDLPNLDLTRYNAITHNPNIIHDIYQPAGSEHYRLLCLLSTWFNDTTIYELGTWIGTGTVCLAYNPTNKVISCDIEPRVDVKPLPNVEYRIGDYKQDPDLLKSPFLFIDVSHDGELEKEIYKFLIDNNYKGLTVWDDIHLNPEMKDFWSSVTHEKRDISRYGHYSGTGIIFFE